jgi:hypothetical protein
MNAKFKRMEFSIMDNRNIQSRVKKVKDMNKSDCAILPLQESALRMQLQTAF